MNNSKINSAKIQKILGHRYKTKLIKSYNINALKRKNKFDEPCEK